MAYSITSLINEYNSMDAHILLSTVAKRYGILAASTYYVANKQLAHQYTKYGTLPTAGIRSLADGVANSTVTGSNVTQNVTLYSVNGAWDKAYVGTDYDRFFNKQAPLYFNSLAQAVQKSIVYGTNATLGLSSYTGTGFHQYVNTNTAQEVKNFQTTASAANCTSIFAVRFSPFEDMDGAAIVVDPFTNDAGNALYVNPNWVDPITIAGSTGPFLGHQMFFQMDGVMLLPGTTNVAAIRGIQSGSTVTTTMVADMLDAAQADSNTFIFVNNRGKNILNALKEGKLSMDSTNKDWDGRVYTWDGIPIVVTDTITITETGALYGLA